MNKFARLVSALVALFGRKTTVTAAPVKRVYAPNKDGGYSILRLAAENRRLKHTILGLEDVLESVNAWGNKVADNAIAYAAENALLKERILALEDENKWLAIWMEENRMLAKEAMRLLDEADRIGYKDVRVPTGISEGVIVDEDSDDTDGDDYSEWDNAPLYGFKAVKTARYHCRGCRRMQKQRGHRCGKK